MGRERGGRLDRTSLSSTQSQHSSVSHYETIPAEVARQHAATAAMVAYSRSQATQPHDNNMVTRRREGSSEATSPSIVHNAALADGGGLRRQQSVRFVGINGLERREPLTTRVSKGPIESKQQPKQHSAIIEAVAMTAVAMTTNDPVPAIYRPPSRASSIGKTSVKVHYPPSRSSSLGKTNVKAHAESVTTGTSRSSSLGEVDVYSTVSSFRRLPRSKSMYTPSKAPSVFYTNGTPRKESSKLHLKSRSATPLVSQPSTRALQGFKSTSLLYDHKELQEIIREKYESETHEAEKHDVDIHEAEKHKVDIQEARDRFFQEHQKQRLRSKASFLFKSKVQQTTNDREKSFRKSLRTKISTTFGSSDNSSNEHEKSFRKALRTKISTTFGSSDNSSNEHEKSFRKALRKKISTTFGSPDNSSDSNGRSKREAFRSAAHKASRSIKTKFRRVFGRSKDEPIIPEQQVEAKETHVRDYNGDSTPVPGSFEDFSDVPYPDTVTLSRVASRVPSIRVATPNPRSPTSQVPSLDVATPNHQLADTEDPSIFITQPGAQLHPPQTPSGHVATPTQPSSPCAGSAKSIKTAHYDDTTVSNTVAIAGRASQTPKGHELQRLSIINEYGLHYPSGSYRRSHYMKSNQSSAYPHLPSKKLPEEDEDIAAFKLRGKAAKEELEWVFDRYMRTVSAERKASASRRGEIPPQRRIFSRGSQRSSESIRVRDQAEVEDLFGRWEEQKAVQEFLEEHRRSTASRRSVSSSSSYVPFAEMERVFWGDKSLKYRVEGQKTARKASQESRKPNKLIRKSSNASMVSTHGDRTPATNKTTRTIQTINSVPPTPSGPKKFVSFDNPGVTASEGMIRSRKALSKLTNHFPPKRRQQQIDADEDGDDVFSPKESLDKENLPLTQSSTRSVSNNSTDSLQRAYERNTQAYLDMPDPVGMTPQEMANQIEGFVPEPKVLRKHKSTFFGGSSVRVGRKVSPYRRTMSALSQQEASASSDTSLVPAVSAEQQKIIDEIIFREFPLFADPNIVRDPWSGSFETDWYSESVYSRSTSGRTPPPPIEAEAEKKTLGLPAPAAAAMNELAVHTPNVPVDNKMADYNTPPNAVTKELAAYIPKETLANKMAAYFTSVKATTSKLAVYTPGGAVDNKMADYNTPEKAVTNEMAVQTPSGVVDNKMVDYNTPGKAITNDMAIHTPKSGSGVQSTSSSSSQDWKKSTSHEIARLEKIKETVTAPTFVNYALPVPRSLPRAHGRHVREKAQIHDDDDQIIQGPATTQQPLEDVAQKNKNVHTTPLKSILKKPSYDYDFSMLYPPVPELPPPIPPKSPLRNLSKNSLDKVLKARRERIVSEDNEANAHADTGRLAGGAVGKLLVRPDVFAVLPQFYVQNWFQTFRNMKTS